MSVPIPVVSVLITLADGSTREWVGEDMEPGAHYATSRNFTRPPRKSLMPGEARLEPETWIHHEIKFNTDRQDARAWEKAHPSVETQPPSTS